MKFLDTLGYSEEMIYLHALFCAMFFLLADTPETFTKYNLVDGQPDILISIQAEQIGVTWQKGNVWDKPLIGTFYELLKAKNDFFVVLDIGAQTGCFTLLSQYFPNSQWHAFEPIQEAVDVLNTHLDVNHIQNVCVHPIAISDNQGSALLKLPSDSHWGLATLGETPKRFHAYNTRIVGCSDLDTFVSEHNINKVDFIKIDTEGWELYVLRGGKAMITRDKPILLMEFNETNMQQCGVNPQDVIALLRELDYEWKLVSSEDLLCIPPMR